ncbi:MAG: tetratricopeptide repeat protein [Phycisphaerae bacterium]|nr:tetratricopeptide repeat protein [Phycisphaerae bacterium]
MSLILEVLGKGLEADLCDVLLPFYRISEPEWSDFQDSCDTERSPELLQGLEFLRCGDFAAAEKLLENVCRKNPQSTAAYAGMIAALEKLGKLDRVFEFLKKLNQICPYQAPIEFAFGLCYEKLGKPKKAAVRYRCATSLNESYIEGWARLAAVDLVTQNYDEAAECYERLIRIVPEDNRLRASLGGLYLLAGKPEKAGAVFDSAISLEPENWGDDDAKVPDMIAAGKIRLAIDYLQQSLETKGDFADIHVKIANLYSMVGDDGPAMEHYRYALSIHGDYLDALVRMGSHHLVHGRWEEAAETFYLAAEHNERLLINYLGVATACKTIGKPKHAEEYYNLATQMEPNCSLLHSQMIRLHHKITTAEDFVHKLQDQSDTVAMSGEADSQCKPLPENELTAHAQRVASEPNCTEARFHYGVLLRSAGRSSEAIKEFYQTVRSQPLHASGLVKLGVLLWEQNRRDQAETIFDRIFRPDTKQIEIHYRLGLHFHDPQQLREIACEMASSETTPMEESEAQNHLMLSLGNMGLVDRGAMAWKSLNQTHGAKISSK